MRESEGEMEGWREEEMDGWREGDRARGSRVRLFGCRLEVCGIRLEVADETCTHARATHARATHARATHATHAYDERGEAKVRRGCWKLMSGSRPGSM